MKLDSYFTPLPEAIEEAQRRNSNRELAVAVEEYLNNHIPPHFQSPTPVFYLARHVASPNYETLRFIELVKDLEWPIIIGEDTKDIFVSNNVLKRALGKLSVTKSVNRNGDEIIEHFTVLDFNKAQGLPLNEIKLFNGSSLIEFHHELLRVIYPTTVEIIDDSDWIDSMYRGNQLEHYKRFLSLLLTHGIMLEYYEPHEIEFVNSVLEPAFRFVESTFGHKPLLCNLVTEEIATQRDWNGYPSILYQLIKNATQNNIQAMTINTNLKSLRIGE